jgi:hypothetical protein
VNDNTAGRSHSGELARLKEFVAILISPHLESTRRFVIDFFGHLICPNRKDRSKRTRFRFGYPFESPVVPLFNMGTGLRCAV